MQLRPALAALAAAAVVLVIAPAGQVAAREAASSPEAGTFLRQTRAEVRVDAFFRAYRQAVLGRGEQSPEQVRARYLTPELDTRLDAWAARNGADPVFRAQNVPSGWSSRYEGSGAGHTTVVVTEKWGSGATHDVWFAVRSADLVIGDLKDPPA
ncbi:hypothetical protein C5F59_002485 [Streptomyces sp. QL37]|uniref:hypothetical protein n=1 Tax=Streptomyces sp. QL37 TaxID=2093747 RepID=UPI000CF1E7E3|nr:hypothetical protein [Streptomyces sp. QL37]PPQ55688.1 hypothetical protein C5F59_02495 [Streptomyces sp. QL37]